MRTTVKGGHVYCDDKHKLKRAVEKLYLYAKDSCINDMYIMKTAVEGGHLYLEDNCRRKTCIS